MGDELTIGTGMMKAFPVQKNEVKKVPSATEVISQADNNRQALRTLRDQGYNVKEVKNNETGKTYPPPTSFMSLIGLNKMTDLTVTVEKNGELQTIKNDNAFNDVVRKFSGSSAQIIDFLDNKLKNGEINQEDYDKGVKCVKNDDWTGLYNILEKNKLLESFMNWMKNELQRMAGAGGSTPGEMQVAYQQGITLDRKQDKDEDDLQKRIDKLLEKYGTRKD